MALRKDKSYLVLMDGVSGSPEQGEIKDQDVSVDEETFNSLDSNLKDLKSSEDLMQKLKN